MTMSIDHVYCINLERRPDRKRSASEQFAIHGIENVEFIKATDGKLHAPLDIEITPSEWGCADSHIRIWRDILEKGYETVLIFEDDVRIHDGFLENLGFIFQDMKDQEWDFINLGPTPEPFRIEQNWESEYVQKGLSLFLNCYLITKSFAQKLAFINADDLQCAIDTQVINTPLKMYYAKQTLAIQAFQDLNDLKSVATNTDIGLFTRTFPYEFIFRTLIHHVAIVILISFVINKMKSYFA
jgi:GR25 family glycosyltransferase involved in LPS biosynthesis